VLFRTKVDESVGVESRVQLYEQILTKLSPRDQGWLARMVLKVHLTMLTVAFRREGDSRLVVFLCKDMNFGVGPGELLKQLHPRARDMFSNNCNLRRVCTCLAEMCAPSPCCTVP
jgi:hypothetical protein